MLQIHNTFFNKNIFHKNIFSWPLNCIIASLKLKWTLPIMFSINNLVHISQVFFSSWRMKIKMILKIFKSIFFQLLHIYNKKNKKCRFKSNSNKWPINCIICFQKWQNLHCEYHVLLHVAHFHLSPSKGICSRGNNCIYLKQCQHLNCTGHNDAAGFALGNPLNWKDWIHLDRMYISWINNCKTVSPLKHLGICWRTTLTKPIHSILIPWEALWYMKCWVW